MTALRRKLRSRRGASMLLALLFLLICVMVSASILMAAASNAGKHRSNLTEHQTYLALSSAVSLLCDELNRSQYQGQYQYWTTVEIVGYDDDGNPITVTRHHLKQLEGKYLHTGTETEGYLKAILLLNFDALFAKDISGSSAVRGFTTVSILDTPVPTTHTLTVTPATGTALDDRPVTVKLEVQDSYAMYLTATLDGMELRAELTPIASSRPGLPPSLSEEKIYTTDPMKWKIGWITTGGEEEGP